MQLNLANGHEMDGAVDNQRIDRLPSFPTCPMNSNARPFSGKRRVSKGLKGADSHSSESFVSKLHAPSESGVTSQKYVETFPSDALHF